MGLGGGGEGGNVSASETPVGGDLASAETTTTTTTADTATISTTKSKSKSKSKSKKQKSTSQDGESQNKKKKVPFGTSHETEAGVGMKHSVPGVPLRATRTEVSEKAVSEVGNKEIPPALPGVPPRRMESTMLRAGLTSRLRTLR